MDCVEDDADITLPQGCCKFDYLVEVGVRERLLLLQKEERKGRFIGEDEIYFLTGIDLDENRRHLIKIPSKIDDEKDGFVRKQGSNGKRPNLDEKDGFTIDVRKHGKRPKIVILGREEWKKKLMGSFHGCCLSWKRSFVKSVVKEKDSKKLSISIRSKTPDSVIPHFSTSGRASSSKIRKRLRYEDENGGEELIKSKKAKRRVPNNGLEPPPGLPVEYRNLIRQLAGDRKVSVEKLVIQKEFTPTDVNDGQSRLSIPGRLVREVFLTEEEELFLRQHIGKNMCSIHVPLITPMMEVADVSFRRWEMRKLKGVPSVSYVIARTWNKI